MSRMPELSRFYGIIIRMYCETGGPHHVAHFHAYYQDEVAIFSINPIESIGGSLPQRQAALGGSMGRAAPRGASGGLATVAGRSETPAD